MLALALEMGYSDNSNSPDPDISPRSGFTSFFSVCEAAHRATAPHTEIGFRLVAAGEILAEAADEMDPVDAPLAQQIIAIELQLIRILNQMRESYA